MHPLETTAAKMEDWTIERIEKVTDSVYLSLEAFNKLPSKARHTAKDWRRFAWLPSFGGWKKVTVV